MDPSQHKKLKSLFLRHDKDNSGTVDVSELKSIFKEMGISKTDGDLSLIMKNHSAGSGREMSFKLFMQLFSAARLRDVFDSIDADKSGHISNIELSDAMKQLGYRMSPSKCEAMLKTVDYDGQVSFEEFRTFFENIPLASLESIAAHWDNVAFVTDCGTDMAATVPPSGLQLWQSVVSGGFGGVASRTITAPLE